MLSQSHHNGWVCDLSPVLYVGGHKQGNPVKEKDETLDPIARMLLRIWIIKRDLRRGMRPPTLSADH
jgi:hypothetical protein